MTLAWSNISVYCSELFCKLQSQIIPHFLPCVFLCHSVSCLGLGFVVLIVGFLLLLLFFNICCWCYLEKRENSAYFVFAWCEVWSGVVMSRTWFSRVDKAYSKLPLLLLVGLWQDEQTSVCLVGLLIFCSVCLLPCLLLLNFFCIYLLELLHFRKRIYFSWKRVEGGTDRSNRKVQGSAHSQSIQECQ